MSQESLTITQEQQQSIAAFVNSHDLAKGLGTRKRRVRIAAINLALSGELTDRVPECMSLVVGKWIIGVQDAMPDAMRNGSEWKRLLPLAAGTGRGSEPERAAIILEWMWATVLPSVQEIATAGGFGEAWATMCSSRTAEAAE